MNPLTGQTVVVTGGTGTFGRAFLAYALAHGVKTLRVVSRNEHRQAEMAKAFPDARIRWLLRDVTDADGMDLALRGADLVFHAAAMKRIEACAENPHQAVAVNVAGTATVCRMALRHGVRRTVLISSDKACQPITLYGSTKACAEHVALGMHAYAGADHVGFSVVRYGNVAGSQGSVIPRWHQCVRTRAPITVTDPAMTRYWITIEEAVRFTVEAVAQAPGRIHVPAMPSFRVMDLVEAIGGPAYPTEHIGVRGIEKLHEDLVAPYEQVIGADGPRRSDQNGWWLGVQELREALASLSAVAA